jgi:SAM-dependent methyltransferase
MRAEQFDLHADIEDTHWWFVGRRRIMARLLRHVVPPSAEATVIDIGCGAGANLAELARHYRCVGIDPSRHAIELARRRFPGVAFVHGTAPRDVAGEIASARAVLLMDVLEHVEDDRGLLADVVAAAPPGAVLLLTVPADAALWGPHDEVFGHFRRYDLAGWRRLWLGLPVGEMLVSYYNSRLYRAVRAVRTVGRLRGKAHGHAGTDFRVPSPRINAALTRVFAGEAERLVDVLEKRRLAFSRGVSLIALLRREPGNTSGNNGRRS